MSFANLPYDIVFDVLSLIDFPTRSLPKHADPTKPPCKPDFQPFEDFQKLSGTWNRALLRLKYREIKWTTFDEITVDFYAGELRLFPSQDDARNKDISCAVSFEEAVESCFELRTTVISIGDVSPTKSCAVDVKMLAECFHEAHAIRIENLTSKHRFEGEFISHLNQDFAEIRLQDVKGQGKSLKKFFSNTLKSPKLAYLALERCSSYKTLSDDILALVKKRACQVEIAQSGSFEYSFYESLIDWWQREGAERGGKDRVISFALRRDAGDRLIQQLGAVRHAHHIAHERDENRHAYVSMIDRWNVCVKFM